MENSYYFLWDYNLSNKEFLEILDGQLEKGRLNQDWAITRLLEYGKYEDIIRLLGYKKIVVYWPRLRERVRSHERKRGIDFLVEWLPENRPELLAA
jgi:hypothetical protein